MEPTRTYQELAATLARLDDSEGLAALEALSEHEDEDARRRALTALIVERRRRGACAVDLLRQGFGDSIAEVREATLGLYEGEPELAHDLARLLADRAQAVRELASRHLRRLRCGDAEALGPAFALLADSGADLRNRVRAVQALGYPCGSEAHRQALVGALTDPEDGLRVNASRALEGVGPDPALASRLRALFEGADAEVRVSLVWGLAMLEDRDSLALFVELLTAEDERLRLPAVAGLRRLGDASTLPALRALWEELRGAVA